MRRATRDIPGNDPESEKSMNVNADTRGVIKKIVQKLVAGYALEKIILFGSYAYGRPDADSDIDL